jgi:hypothetical protein
MDTIQTNKYTHKNTNVKFQIQNSTNQKQEIKDSHNITKHTIFYTLIPQYTQARVK